MCKHELNHRKYVSLGIAAKLTFNINQMRVNKLTSIDTFYVVIHMIIR